MRIRLIYKRIGNYTGGMVLALCCFFGTYDSYKKHSIKLSDLNKYPGIVTDKGITKIKHSVAGKGSYSSDVFYVKLDGLHETLASHNTSQEYAYLDHQIEVGNTITVWYFKSSKSDQVNINTYRIEGKNGLILSEEKFRNKQQLGGWIAAIGGLLLLVLTFYNDSKHWEKNER